jgi:hypothetical protein
MGLNTTGGNNTALGSLALYSNTTASYNTALGALALYSNTTAANNVAVGYQSMYNNTTGSGTAVGYQALSSNTTGSVNVAIGWSALGSNTTGTGNTAIGQASNGVFNGALYANTTGTGNTAVGAGTLIQNTTASYNTAVGYLAGYSNTTSGNSVYVGYQAGYSATGATNVGVGSNIPGFYNSVLYATTGTGNTAVGPAAGSGITSGTTNIAMGNSAMAVGPVTGGTNIAIGWGAGIALTSGSSNTFVGSGRAGFSFGAGSAMTTGSANTILGTFSGNQNGLDIRTGLNYIVLSDGDGVPRGIFDGSGNFFVGTTTTGFTNTNGTYISPFSGGGNVNIGHSSTVVSGTAYVGFGFNTSSIGSISQSGTTAVLYNTTSDQRLKTNIVDAPESNIDSIKVRSFDWISDGSHQTYGMIAQELAEAAPYAVSQSNNPDEMMGVDYSKLVPMMVKEIQSLRNRLLALENCK